MSAPNTDIERQRKTHWPPLVGIAAVLVFAGIVFFFNVRSSVQGDGPLGAYIQHDAPVLKSDPSS